MHNLLTDLFIAGVVVAWTFLATVDWIHWIHQDTPPAPERTTSQ